MDERKIILLTFFVIIYGLYSAHVWFTKDDVHQVEPENLPALQDTDSVSQPEIIKENYTLHTDVKHVKTKPIPLFFKNACSVLQVFTEKPVNKKTKQTKTTETIDSNNTITAIGVTVFLIVLTLNAVLDIIKVKEEEKERRKLFPNGERRQSLAEFANKKPLRRESSKFGFQLFQITESVSSSDEEKSRRQTRPYTRGDSTNSYLSERNVQKESSPPASVGDIAEPKLVKRQSVAKLVGMSYPI